MSHRLRHRPAFTLVELLVVIGIIGLLLGILLPTLGRAREQAFSVKCMSNMRQLHVYVAMYSVDNKDWVLPANAIYNYWEAGDWYGILARQYFKAPMTGAGGVLLKGEAAIKAMAPTQMPKLLTCPSIKMAPYNSATKYHTKGVNDTPIMWTYTYNRNMGDKDKLVQFERDGDTPSAGELVQYSQKKRNALPASTLVLADIAPWLPAGRGANTYRFFTLTREVNPLDPKWATDGGYLGAPHGGKQKLTNVLLASGEVLSVKLEKYNEKPNIYFIDARDWSATSTTRKVSNSFQHTLK